MEIIKCKVEEIIVKVGYSYKEKYSDNDITITFVRMLNRMPTILKPQYWKMN